MIGLMIKNHLKVIIILTMIMAEIHTITISKQRPQLRQLLQPQRRRQHYSRRWNDHLVTRVLLAMTQDQQQLRQELLALRARLFKHVKLTMIVNNQFAQWKLLRKEEKLFHL